MVLRSYSRRHLGPASRALQRHVSTVGPSSSASTSAPAAQSQASDGSASSQQRATAGRAQQHEGWSFFFPEHLPWAQRQAIASSRAKHPLVKKLISEIYSTSRDPDANRVWKAYMDLKESYDSDLASTSTTASTSLLTQLDASHLQQLLRAIDPSVARTRTLTRAESKRRHNIQQQQSSLASTSAPSKILFIEPHRSRHSGKIFDSQHPMREYMRRVQIIFRDMRIHSSIVPSTSTTVDALPNLADYNHVLSRLASGGHIGPMSAIWNELTGVSHKANTKGLHPNRYTYRELMVGLSRHATDQIERVQKAEASKLFNHSGNKKQLAKSARAAAAGIAKFGEVLAPSTRAAAILAALRTMALLKDMKDHAVAPTQITLDFAARTLRLAGHIDGLHLLMQQAYGIDLASPDSAVPAQTQSNHVQPTTHTLNTILMALGEQATVPEMIAAFETLSKPLPLTSTRADVTITGEGIFSTNWRDVFSSMRKHETETSQEGTNADEISIPDVFTYSSPHRIVPNTKTFEVLLRHCCSEVDPLRSPVALKTESNTSSVATLVKKATETALAEMQDGGRRAAEMERRVRGGYSLFAKSLLSEALERSDELLHLTARNLGIDIARTEQTTTEEALELDNQSSETPGSSHVRPEYSRVSVTPGRALDADFLPILEPPTFSITATMVEPFFSLASSRRRTAELRWVRSALSKALENKAAEAQVVDAAWRVYSARIARTRQPVSAQEVAMDSEPNGFENLSPLQLNGQNTTEAFAFLQRLRQQHKFATRQAQALEQLLYDRLDERMRDLARRRLRRQIQRVTAHRQERLKAEQEKIEEEEREAARKAQAAEARRLRALQKEDQQNPQASANDSSSQLQAVSTVAM